MDWSILVRQVISLGAPLIGTALGGPFGAAAGQILASAVGAPAATPAAVQEALPAANAEALAAAEARWAEMVRAEAEATQTAIRETQATIRAEIASEDPIQKWWRPLYAFELTFECAGLWVVLLHEFWTSDLQTLNAMIGATTLFVSYWAFRFGVLGVYVSGRTREKVCAAMGEDAPGLIEKVAKAVLKRK
jgi:hypothetical protein